MILSLQFSIFLNIFFSLCLLVQDKMQPWVKGLCSKASWMALCLKVYGKALIKKNLIICIYGLQLGRGNNFEDMSANNSIFSPSVVWTSYFFFISNHFRLFSFQTYFNTCEKKLVLIGMAKSFGGGGGGHDIISGYVLQNARCIFHNF